MTFDISHLVIFGRLNNFVLNKFAVDLSFIKLYERKNQIVRKSVNLSKQTHIIASNIDQAFLIVTLALPETTTGFIDRFLVSANAFGVDVILLFNKNDLYKSNTLLKQDKIVNIYENCRTCGS